MKCREFEAQLCDYIDDSLAFDERRSADEHLLECVECANLHSEAEFAGRVLREAPAVEAPVELVADIIHSTIGYAGRAPVSATVAAPPEDGVLARLLRPIFSPILQPRFVMSMAMTMLSFSMLTFHAQNLWQRWQSGEFSNSETVQSVELQIDEAWDNTVEFYDAAVMLYELQTGFGEPSDGALNQESNDGN